MALAKQVSDETEYALFKEYRRTKDKKLRDRLVNSYIYIAEILSRRFINRGIEYDDIYQVACLGILYAVERFDPDKGVKFATFATPTVLGEIRHYFRDKGSFIKIPRGLYEVFYKAEQIRRSSADMSTGEIARILNLPENVVEEAYDLGGAAFLKSLENEAFANGEMNLSNVIGREDNNFIMIENRDFIRSCLSQLSEQEREFVKLRYYDELTQRDIAAKWGVSQMYVSRLEKKTLKKLKNMYFRD